MKKWENYSIRDWARIENFLFLLAYMSVPPWGSKALPTPASSQSFTGISPNKYLAWVILSWFLLLGWPEMIQFIPKVVLISQVVRLVSSLAHSLPSKQGEPILWEMWDTDSHKMAIKLLNIPSVMTCRNIPMENTLTGVMTQGFERHGDGAYKNSRVTWLLLIYFDVLQWDNEKLRAINKQTNTGIPRR